jgi:glycosyltransferase involved in cell wall biosynthesis
MDHAQMSVKPQMSVCFLGSARYGRPLDPKSEKKFRALQSIARVCVIGFSTDARPHQFVRHARFYLVPATPIRPVRYVVFFAAGTALAFWSLWRHNVRVIVAQSPYEGFAAAWAKIAAAWFGRKAALVIESHGDFEEYLFLRHRVRFPGLCRLFMRHVARFALSRTDMLRAVSADALRQLKRRAPDVPAFLFPAWTDIDIFQRAGRLGTAKRTPKNPYILYCGLIGKPKGVHHLVYSFARIAPYFPQVQLIIAGRAENDFYMNELKSSIARANLTERVLFRDEASQTEVAEWMAEASMFVLPSLSEGLPRVALEAMATGTPVIASRVGGIPELIQDGETGFLIPPGDEDALADRMRRLLENPKEARETGERARASAGRFFSTESYIENYRSIFQAAYALLDTPDLDNERFAP